jgi:hypothetical protein
MFQANVKETKHTFYVQQRNLEKYGKAGQATRPYHIAHVHTWNMQSLLYFHGNKSQAKAFQC